MSRLQQRRQTELVRQKAVSLKQSLNESHIEESTLQARLAGYKQRAEHLHRQSKQLDLHIQLLKQSHANEAGRLQVSAICAELTWHSLTALVSLLTILIVHQATLSSLDTGRTDCKGEAAESEYD